MNTFSRAAGVSLLLVCAAAIPGSAEPLRGVYIPKESGTQ
ncbi:hypothetical protein BH24ACI4_BH24ACI4_17340 [soil metagenome]